MPPSPEEDALKYRSQRASLITDDVGVYALCDLDEVPIYVGQSTDGIRRRVRRHLTSARSDVIANRQLDVWEIAFVWAWPVSDVSQIAPLEAHMFHRYHSKSPLMNGSIPAKPRKLGFSVPGLERTQIMSDEEIETRRDAAYRLPRQAEHFVRLVDHILNVKDSPELRRSLEAHFERLSSYYDKFLQVR